MNERYIAAVDFGSSNIVFTVAKLDNDQSQIIYYKKYKSKGIKYSEISNPKQVSEILAIAFEEAEKELGLTITQAVVGLPRYKIRTEDATFATERNSKSCIEEEEINNIKEMTIDDYPSYDPETEEIFGANIQSFSADSEIGIAEEEIVGMIAHKLEGQFKLYIGKKSASENIDHAFNIINKSVALKLFSPQHNINILLRESEKKSGVALIDFGAGVVSLSIIHGGILRYYYSLPFAGNTITSDIEAETSYISRKLAENIKMSYGACMPNKLFSLGDKIIQVNDTSSFYPIQISVKYLSEVITERVKEIVDALLYHIQLSGFADVLKSGIVLTGGGAELLNLANFIKECSGYSVKIGYPKALFTTSSNCSRIYETDASTILSYLLETRDNTRINCAVLSNANLLQSEDRIVVEREVLMEKVENTKPEGNVEPSTEEPREEKIEINIENKAEIKSEKQQQDVEEKEEKKPTNPVDEKDPGDVFNPAKTENPTPVKKKKSSNLGQWAKNSAAKVQAGIGSLFDQTTKK